MVFVMLMIKVIAAFVLCYLSSVKTAPTHLRQPRLSLAEETPSYFNRGANGTYTFGYDVLDPETGNTQFRSEERYPNGTVVGSYGYMDALGKARRFDYIADDKGYRVVSNKLRQEPNTPAAFVNPSTEDPVVWTRPPKQKNKLNKPIERRQFNRVQPPSYYLLY